MAHPGKPATLPSLRPTFHPACQRQSLQPRLPGKNAATGQATERKGRRDHILASKRRVTMATGSSDPHTDAALASDMMSLNTLLARPQSGKLLYEWKRSIKHPHLGEGIVFDSIHCLKKMDRLLTPTHADAFD